MQGGTRIKKTSQDLLVPNKTTERHAAPAHAAHETASKALATVPVDIVAVLDVHGDGLGAGADKRVLPRAAHGSIEAWASSHGGVVAIAQFDVGVDVGVDVESGVGEELVGLRALLGMTKGGCPGI